jgi:hypothetical protein
VLTPDQLYRQAQQADRQGQVPEAIRLYALLGAETAHTRPDLSAWALQRAQYLQGGHQNYGASVGPSATGPTAGRVYALPTSTASVQVGAPVTPRAASSQDDVMRTTTIRRDSSAFTPQPTTGPPRGSQSQWLGYRGVLRRAGRMNEGQTTYALDDPVTLRPLLYATAGTGVNLDAYQNRIVQLWGWTVYRGDLKNNHMIATRVIPVQ